MRTGAIFARGSCRALKWMALVGMVFALGSVEAAAQAPTLEAEWTPESAVVTITASEDVWTQGASADDFMVTWTGQTAVDGTSHTIPGAVGAADDMFNVTFEMAIPTGADTVVVTYTAPTPLDPQTQILDTDDDGYAAVATGALTTTEEDVDPMIGAIDGKVFPKDMAITAFQLPAATGNAPFTYDVIDLPDGLTFDSDGADNASGTAAEREDDRMISGTPTMVTDGAQIVTYTVTDASTPADRTAATFTITVTDKPAKPSMPNVAPTPNTGGSLDVMWTAPAHNNSAIFDYEVQHREVGATNWEMHTADLGTRTSETFPGLTVGTEYEFQVRARNGVDWSDWSDSGKGTPDDTPLSVTVTAAPTTIAEGGMSTITATANRMVAADDGTVTVNLRVAGEATLSMNSITIVAGQMSGTATLTSTADADYEPDTVEVTVTGVGVAANHPNVVITVTDDAPSPDLTVTVSAAPTTIAEGGMSTITATANRMVAADDGTVTVNLRVAGEATLDMNSITIAAGEMSGTATLTSTADADYEPDTVEVTVTGVGVAADHPNVVITVTDDAPPPDLTVTVSAAPTTIAEGGTSTITAMASRMVMAGDGTVTVDLSVVGEATLSASSITIATGADSGTVTLTSTEDADYETDTVTVVARGTGITGDQQIEITVTDPEPTVALTVTVSAAPTTITEGGTSTVTAMANRMVTADDETVTVNLSVVGEATLSANAITIAAGANSGTVTLTATEDADYDDETVTVTASGTGITGNQEVEITVVDNDTRPTDPVGRITKVTVKGAEERTIDGVKRMHVDEGVLTEAEVTVEWTPDELRTLAGRGVTSVRVYLQMVSYAGNDKWLSPAEHESTHDDVTIGGWFTVKVPEPPTNAADRVPKTAMGTTSLALNRDRDAENEAFGLYVWNDEDFDRVVDSGVHVIDDTDPQGIELKRVGSGAIYEGGADVVFEVTADPPREQLVLEVRFDLEDVTGQTVASRQNAINKSIGTIPVGGEKETVSVTLDKNDRNRKDDELNIQAEVVVYAFDTGAYGDIGKKEMNFEVRDVHKLPHLTVSPMSGAVTEGDEDGIELTLNVNRNPANTIATDPETLEYTSEALTIAVTAGGSASSSDFTMTPSAITVPEYKHATDPGKDWMQDVKVTIAASADEDIDAETLMLDFMVNGKPENGPRPDDDTRSVAQANLTIQDATATLVSVRENAYDVIKGALGDPPMLTTGMSAELMGGNLFDYDSAAVSVAYATSVEGGAVTASASGGTVTIMGAMAGDAKVTITATATPTAASLVVNQTKANVAQMTFPVTVEDEDLVFMVAGPEDMNISEGGMGGMVTVTTNRPVTANTEVMLMRDGSSTAGDADFKLEPPLVTIMAGQKEGSTMVMAEEDGMAEEMEMLTLFLVVDGMQMTDKSVSFYIWDAAVPALPIIAQLLLAGLLAVGGFRRYRRR